jgi:uncharacterized Fe-S cluster protein YjdI
MRDLSRYDSSSTFNNIDDSIKDALKNKLEIANNTTRVNVNGKMIIGEGHIFKEYKNLIFGNLEEIPLEPKYHYRPERLSKDIYGTVDLWYLLLWVNQMTMNQQFVGSKIKVINDQGINLIIRICDRNYERTFKSRRDPELIPDLTIKKVIT